MTSGIDLIVARPEHPEHWRAVTAAVTGAALRAPLDRPLDEPIEAPPEWGERIDRTIRSFADNPDFTDFYLFLEEGAPTGWALVHRHDGVECGHGANLYSHRLGAVSSGFASALDRLADHLRARGFDYLDLGVPRSWQATVSRLRRRGFVQQPWDTLSSPTLAAYQHLSIVAPLPDDHSTRWARMSDVETVTEMMVQFLADQGTPLPAALARARIERKVQTSGDCGGFLLLECVDGLVGACNLSFVNDAETVSHGVISDFTIARSGRNRGLGTSLVREMVDRAVARGTDVMMGEVARVNAGAMRFWERFAVRDADEAHLTLFLD